MNTFQEILTIGHSGRTFDEFLSILRSYNVEAIADVRRFPVSSRFPHFSQMDLFKRLTKANIQYVPFQELGGRRRPQPNSPNTRWQNESFRGYADYMGTSGFANGMDRLLQLAMDQRTAIMCAEAIWWRCHRVMIADYLKNLGFKVTHILSANRAQEHRYSSAARVMDGKLSYAPEETPELVLG